MRAATFDHTGDESVLSVRDVPTPEPGAGEIRIKVAAATVNRTDLNARSGLYSLADPGPHGHRLGMDAAGTVDAVGTAAGGFVSGDKVIAFSGAAHRAGAQAEYLVLPVDAIAPAPKTGTPAQAATLPLNGLTAAQAVRAAALPDASAVIVTGAAGGLGMVLVQLLNQTGHRVTAWVKRDTDADFVRPLGAEQVITEAGQTTVRSAAAVFDAANLGQASIDLIEDGGAFVTFRQAKPDLDRSIQLVNVMVNTDGTLLRQLVDLVDAGTLRLPEAEELPLTDVAEAQRRFNVGGVRSRLVLVP